ncbi:NAD(P)H-binding protein [Altererythrobacter sp. KTW20L]|uniref:NAD(P)H-binding protein n=1 Tax=Altererythrobacter sp. KTW20L TaxID=2942210 RepID=UPI0020C1666F|nr:NAD(P)H-binding protein [Altererythrobacter sp. KTW20L]MCL6249541.1 NAD(P)H-binding protein [Altererythrobacter sp. KTW20L]
MSDPLRVLLLGASGLVGRCVLEQAVGRSEVRLVGLSRREVALPPGSLMEVHLAPVEGWAQEIAAIAPDHVICALGTTIRKQGGDAAAFASVDRDQVLDVARMAKNAGARGFVAVSSVGADPSAKALYMRTKGEMEAGLGRCGFSRIDLLRPGLLRGERTGDMRVLERIAALGAPLADLMLQGERRKYRSIRAADVAAAALQAVREKAPGRFVQEHDQIMRLSARWNSG